MLHETRIKYVLFLSYKCWYTSYNNFFQQQLPSLKSVDHNMKCKKKMLHVVCWIKTSKCKKIYSKLKISIVLVETLPLFQSTSKIFEIWCCNKMWHEIFFIKNLLTSLKKYFSVWCITIFCHLKAIFLSIKRNTLIMLYTKLPPSIAIAPNRKRLINLCNFANQVTTN